MSLDLNHTSFSHKCGWKVKSSDESILDVFLIYQSSKNIKINLLFVLVFNALVVSSSGALSALVDSNSKYFRNKIFS